MASLVEQIFVQSGAGSANGQGFGEFFAQGRQIGQEQQRINLAQQQLARQLAMDEINKVTMLQEQQMNAAKLATVLEQRQATAQNEEAFQQLTAVVGRAFAADRPEEAETAVWEALTRHPGLRLHTGMQPLMDNVKTSLTGKLELQKLRQNELTSPELKTLTEPESGRKITMARKGRNMWEEVTGTGELTTANQTKVQERLSASVATIDTANRLDPLIGSDTVGLKAFAQSWVQDRMLAQVFPHLVNDKRVSAERLIAELRAKAVQELGTPPISDKERAEILRAVPGINQPIDSPTRAKQMLADIRKMSAVRAVVAAHKLGEQVPKAAALILTPEELEQLVKTGIITPEQAMAAFDAR